MLCSLARSGETESPAHDRNASTLSIGKYCTIFMHDHPNPGCMCYKWISPPCCLAWGGIIARLRRDTLSIICIWYVCVMLMLHNYS